MQFIDAETIRKYLSWGDVVESLRQMFDKGCVAPVRHHHEMVIPGQRDATMLLMPAWLPGKYAGLKLVNVYPDNNLKGLPTIMGSYLLMNGGTGEPLVSLDAGELTARRTVAASALASDYLSRKNAGRLLIVGSGRLARYLGFAHGSVRPVEEVKIWARDLSRAEQVRDVYIEAGINCSTVVDLEEASGWADIISCATMSTEPIILGDWLQPGVHVDLIGGFKPTMRETDDEAVVRSTVFADTREGVLAEAGDLLIPMENGVFSEKDIVAELSELCSSEHSGRKSDNEITMFKSVGASLEDLAAAVRCYENMKKDS